MTGSSSGCCRHKRVAAILMCSHDGAAFVASQLQSLHEQDHERIDLLVSDDGSSDGTVELLDDWAQRWTKGRFHILTGPRQGFAENFRQAILACPGADYVFFCDQDDLWDRSKVTAAIAALESSASTSALYCSRTRLIDADGRRIGLSPLRRGRPSFRNALAQCIAGGNTMALNAAGFELVQDSARRTPFVSHDWWSYLIVSGAGGRVIYDPTPHISYRQHQGNLVGSNRRIGSWLHRASALWAGRYRNWIGQNVRALEACSDLLSEEARRVIGAFALARTGPMPARLRSLAASGVHRQGVVSNAGLWAAAGLGRV